MSAGMAREQMDVTGIVVRAPKRATLERFTLGIPDGFVEVDVAFCALCTWEQRVFRGLRGPLPFWGGHELSGTVRSPGLLAPYIKPGDPVLVGLMKRCAWCTWCRMGLDNHCAYARPDQPSDDAPAGPRGLSSCIAVPPTAIYRVDSGVSLSRVALGEPLACVLHSVRRSGATAGATAAVIGSGTMGTLHAAVLSAQGVSPVQLTLGRNTERDRRANWPVLELESTLRKPLEGALSGGVDAVFCTQGGAASVNAAVQLVRRGGTIVLFESITSDATLALSGNDLRARELSVIGSLAQTEDDLRSAAALLSTSPQITSYLQTAVVGANESQRAFELAVDHQVDRVLVQFD